MSFLYIIPPFSIKKRSIRQSSPGSCSSMSFAASAATVGLQGVSVGEADGAGNL